MVIDVDCRLVQDTRKTDRSSDPETVLSGF